MGIYVYVQGWGGPYGGYNRSILLTYPKKQQVSTANPLILLHNLYNRVLYQGSVHDLFTGFANENRSQVASRTQALPQWVSIHDLPPVPLLFYVNSPDISHVLSLFYSSNRSPLLTYCPVYLVPSLFFYPREQKQNTTETRILASLRASSQFQHPKYTSQPLRLTY